jgi:hypothetical protein
MLKLLEPSITMKIVTTDNNVNNGDNVCESFQVTTVDKIPEPGS